MKTLGSYCDVSSLMISVERELAGLLLCSVRLDCLSHFHGAVGWSSVPPKTVGVEPVAPVLQLGEKCGFVLDSLPTGTETQVTMLLSFKKDKRRPAGFMQSFLLGLLLSLGGSMEGKEQELDASLQFLKKL